LKLPFPTDGVEIRLATCHAGAKKAVRFGNGPIYVSPAMWELLTKAETPDELHRLIAAIPLVTLPAMPSLFGPLPMTTIPPYKEKS
jgi:hypothetical protein